jgi:hypothetical protein
VSDYAEEPYRTRSGLPDGQVGVYIDINHSAYATAERLYEAWKRPVRHNRAIERAALWYALDVSNGCASLVNATESSEQHGYIRPGKGDVVTRYDAEAAIRMIPEIMPFTNDEQWALRRNRDRRNNFQFEHGIGNTALSQLALAERWHDWLWTPPANPSERQASPGSDAGVLAVACSRLTVALGEILA